MAFWGVEVKPAEPYTLNYEDVDGKLILTQATLGAGSSTKKSILQCQVGDNSPVFLCTLLPDKMESCPLNLEFAEEEGVEFSVVGPTSVHISGFIQGSGPDSSEDQEYDMYGEDIAETDSEGSDYDEDSEDDYEDDFIDDGDVNMFPPSPSRNSGVFIEEIEDDEKPAAKSDKANRSVKKNHASKADVSGRELVVKGTTGTSALESEDEDGFPISSSHENEEVNDQDAEAIAKYSESDKKNKKKKKDEMKGDGAQGKSSKRKVNEAPAVEESQRQSKAVQEGSRKKKKKKSVDEKKADTAVEDNDEPKEANTAPAEDGEENVANGAASEERKKKKKKKKKKKGKEEGVVTPSKESDAPTTEENDSAKKSEAKSSHVRTFSNGLVVEELEMGKPDGKRASAGKKVSVRYIGKLQKNGKIFDSNIGKAPFKFVLGVGQVIKGWDVGVQGMRVGDKRRITVPPSMGYGSKSIGPIPANSWLVFDVELINVA